MDYPCKHMESGQRFKQYGLGSIWAPDTEDTYPPPSQGLHSNREAIALDVRLKRRVIGSAHLSACRGCQTAAVTSLKEK